MLYYTITNSNLNPYLGSTYCKKKDKMFRYVNVTIVFFVFHACIISFKMSNVPFTTLEQKKSNQIFYKTIPKIWLLHVSCQSIVPTLSMVNAANPKKTEYLRVCVLFDSHCLLVCSVCSSLVSTHRTVIVGKCGQWPLPSTIPANQKELHWMVRLSINTDRKKKQFKPKNSGEKTFSRTLAKCTSPPLLLLTTAVMR